MYKVKRKLFTKVIMWIFVINFTLFPSAPLLAEDVVNVLTIPEDVFGDSFEIRKPDLIDFGDIKKESIKKDPFVIKEKDNSEEIMDLHEESTALDIDDMNDDLYGENTDE